jgi:D-3-phosphoglycerate dehydrogenase
MECEKPMTETTHSKVLVSCPLIIDDINDYADFFEQHGVDYDVADVDQQLSENELLDILPGYDGILAGDDMLSRRVLKNASSLKVISKWGIGTDNIDFDAADEFDVEVFNTPGAFAAEVADVVIGYTIMLTRKLHQIDRSVRNGDWFCPRGTSLPGKTFGIVGVGNIGSTVARRAAAHDMEILGNDVRRLPDDLVEETGISSVDLDRLFNESDIVSLNCALTEETRGLIRVEQLQQLGSEGYLINTSRGELIEQDALVQALNEGDLAGAALDVFEQEPLPAEDALTQFDNVILGSHNAQNTKEAVERVNQRAVKNLVEILR